MKMKVIPTEYDEHVALADWLRAHRVCFFHAPNGEGRTSKTIIRDGKLVRYSLAGQRLQRMGVREGVPDFIILDPPMSQLYRGKVGTVIELKRAKGGKASEAQQAWLRDFGARDWLAYVCRGADEAIATLELLGYGRMR